MIRLRLEMYPKAAAWIERPFTLRSKRSGLGSRSSKASQSVRVYRRANGSCIVLKHSRASHLVDASLALINPCGLGSI